MEKITENNLSGKHYLEENVIFKYCFAGIVH